MKKLLLSLAVLGLMTFAACSEDEKDYTPNYIGCMHCEIPDEAGYEVCVDDSGNAFVGNADTGIELEQYFELFCDNEPSENPGPVDPVPTGDCVTCAATSQVPVPVEICEGDNGHAVVGGVDMQIDFDEYVAQYEESMSTTCE
ncbi:hypothetical protein [uncultured Flavobacterium sp.]|uniref:hypothetical protein n=1 Tax=uncultured Flavobacterium sp. TaxID=165435 RepID=UPI0025E0C2CD|nr:hypothetical protein [uncultured Flavobacterium sp.]